MSTLTGYCKKIIKKFVEYRIVDDVKVFSLRHTPFRVTRSLKKIYENNWAGCEVESHKIVFDNYMG